MPSSLFNGSEAVFCNPQKSPIVISLALSLRANGQR